MLVNSQVSCPWPFGILKIYMCPYPGELTGYLAMEQCPSSRPHQSWGQEGLSESCWVGLQLGLSVEGRWLSPGPPFSDSSGWRGA